MTRRIQTVIPIAREKETSMGARFTCGDCMSTRDCCCSAKMRADRAYRRRMKLLKCVRCRCKTVTRPRGLCWTCYYAPGVRAATPGSPSPKAHRGVGIAHPTRMPEPTDEMPGSKAKVETLAARAAAGEHLWHPLDARG